MRRKKTTWVVIEKLLLNIVAVAAQNDGNSVPVVLRNTHDFIEYGSTRRVVRRVEDVRLVDE